LDFTSNNENKAENQRELEFEKEKMRSYLKLKMKNKRNKASKGRKDRLIQIANKKNNQSLIQEKSK
jgi:hypothetical protein